MGKWIRHGDWYPDRKNRLLRRSMGIWEGGQVHEHLAIEGEIYHLKGDLLHYSYDSILDFPKKVSIYANQFARQRMKMEKRFQTFKFGLDPCGVFLEVISLG